MHFDEVIDDNRQQFQKCSTEDIKTFALTLFTSDPEPHLGCTIFRKQLSPSPTWDILEATC